ncbi:MAG: ABC transporter ATP-binding protein [Anaerolineales bacterium]
MAAAPGESEGALLVASGLVIRSVDFGYADRIVLSDVSLQVAPGKIVAVVGPNGVGKTTLIKGASGVLPLHSGDVLVEGQSLSQFSPDQRARRISVVNQAINLPQAFTALDVVLMGRTPYLGWFEREGEEDRRIALDAMRQTETDQFADRPLGELSGGEQQRVLIARALTQAAPVMLLDEPTAHLDLRHQDQLLKLLARLTRERGLSTLIALHDLNLVSRFSDTVVLLSNGRVHSCGDPESVLTPDQLERVYGLRIHVMTHPLNGRPLILTGE